MTFKLTSAQVGRSTTILQIFSLRSIRSSETESLQPGLNKFQFHLQKAALRTAYKNHAKSILIALLFLKILRVNLNKTGEHPRRPIKLGIAISPFRVSAKSQIASGHQLHQ